MKTLESHVCFRFILVGDMGIKRPAWTASILRVDMPGALRFAAGSEILAIRR